jgi:hypothetical protein
MRLLVVEACEHRRLTPDEIVDYYDEVLCAAGAQRSPKDDSPTPRDGALHSGWAAWKREIRGI